MEDREDEFAVAGTGRNAMQRTAMTAIYGAVFYIVTTITLKKRLNLE